MMRRPCAGCGFKGGLHSATPRQVPCTAVPARSMFHRIAVIPAHCEKGRKVTQRFHSGFCDPKLVCTDSNKSFDLAAVLTPW